MRFRFSAAFAASLSRACTRLLALAALCLFSLPGVSRADLNITGTVDWSTGQTVSGTLMIGVGADYGILNHSGGTVTAGSLLIGQEYAAGGGSSAYNMSGTAVFSCSDSYIGNLRVDPNTYTWSLTDNASATVGSLDLNRLSDCYLLLSGAATFTASSLVGVHADSWISFAPDCTATLTVTGQSYNYYKGLIEGGFIRVDGASATMSQFQVVGSTLSLATGGPTPPHLVITDVNGGLDVTAGSDFSVTVQAQNDSNEPAPLAEATEVTLTLKNGTGTGTLGGIVSGTIAANSSSVTISGVTYTKAESSVVLEASASGLAAGESAAFTVVPGAANQLAFTIQPSVGAPGEVWGTQPVVTVQDANGNTVDSDASIELAITMGTPTSGGPGTLSGTKTVSAVSGVATFSGLSIDTAGTGYQLTATSAGLAFADSSAFDIAVPGDSTINFWTINGITQTWTSTSWYDGTTFHDTGGNGMIAVRRQLMVGAGGGASGLNQTGGTINATGATDGAIIGQVANGTYSMSGNASYTQTDRAVIFGNAASATWTLTGTASVAIGELDFGQASQSGRSRHLLLSGAASFNTTSLVFNNTDDDYISFATGSTATLTVTAVLPENAPAYYEALVTNGSIRVDGVQAAMSQFQVVDNILSLATGGTSPYTSWAGGNAFDSLNSEGVAYGMAWLLGATTNSSPSIGLLPESTNDGGKLVMTFDCLSAAARGAAVLKVQYSKDLGQSDLWTGHEAEVPGVVGSSDVGSVHFEATENGGLIHVVATVAASEASTDGKLFGRLQATE